MTSEKRSSAERDQRVLDLYDRVLEIEQRLIPTGLHVFGQPSTKAELTDMLCMVAAFDRPEQGIRALPDLVASGLGLEEYAILVNESSASESRMSERERVEATVRESVLCFLEAGENGTEAASTLLSEKASVPVYESVRIFSLLGEIRSLLQSNFEIEALLRGLRGEYIEPGPGADIIQNPSILPTGRNTHAINPNAVPSMAAVRRAEPLAQSLVARFQKET
ncbi:MAG TPA: cobaltochelatase subunit CobN, partial [Blastocatellia bacterium]|nr:cobaltochelatase subunit CobN [Blastocatellia bacterium]